MIHTAPSEFATQRLPAERLRLDHIAELVDMHCDERIVATLGGRRSMRIGAIGGIPSGCAGSRSP